MKNKMKFDEAVNNIISEMGRPKIARPHKCQSFDVDIKDLNAYSKDFQKKIKKLDRKIATAKKWLYNRKGDKLGSMDETFWNNYGNEIDEMIEEIFGVSGQEPPEKYRSDVYKFYSEHDYDMGKYSTPSIGDFMC